MAMDKAMTAMVVRAAAVASSTAFHSTTPDTPAKDSPTSSGVVAMEVGSSASSGVTEHNAARPAVAASLSGVCGHRFVLPKIGGQRSTGVAGHEVQDRGDHPGGLLLGEPHGALVQATEARLNQRPAGIQSSRGPWVSGRSGKRRQDRQIQLGGSSYRVAPRNTCCPQRATYTPASSSMA